MSGTHHPYGRKGAPFVKETPQGEDRERLVCPDCGFIAYENPKLVVGAVCVWQGRILLCRRAIEPRPGYWTIPAGFMEMDETTAEGAAREVWEEAQAKVHVDGLVGYYEIPFIGQIYVVYRARLVAAQFGPGPESAEVALFEWDDLPWDRLAFPSIRWALEQYRRDEGPVVHVATAPM